ncbi:hypothetical protein GCM10011390_43520 [Aureimonas endophytica]|uniref:Uncharacterized protein n=1 Tax=Aureimonas endophytica TaxID=2027858 RepID=A0A916ZZ15_9HYPH|nr:hypothetical protein [Aureimonas endophytica]GGE19574.1 hypothetical protein GCM10011390_43520 [Aureimonas endophytica]
MEQVAAFMMLVGCSADAQACHRIPVWVPTYQDVATCERDLRAELRLNAFSADRLYGACRSVDAATFRDAKSIGWSISRDGRLDIRFDLAPQVVAAR